MSGKVTELPVQTIYGDAPWTQRALEKYNEFVGSMGPSPFEQEAKARAVFEDLATSKGLASNGAAYVLGPAAGLAPEAPLAAAAVGGGLGALQAYADDPQHRASSALVGGGLGAATGGALAKIFGGTPAIQGLEQTPAREPANMLAVGKSGKELIKKLSPEEANARYRWVNTNSSEIQRADAAHQTDGEYGKLAQTLKGMAEKYPSPPATLYRGAHLPASTVEQMAKSGRTGTQRMESWSTNPETSQAFALGKHIPGKVPVLFKQEGASGLALNPLESEVLVPGARDYKVKSVNTAPDGTKIVTVTADPNAQKRKLLHSALMANVAE